MKHSALAVFIVIFAFISISIFLSELQLKKLSSSDFVIKTLDQSGIYNNLPDLINQAFKDSENGVDVINNSFDPNYIRSQIEKNLPNFTAYLNGKRQTTGVEIDIRPYSSMVNTDQVTKLQEQMAALSKLPPCPAGSGTEINENSTCLPSDEDFNQKIASLDELLKGIAAGVLKLDDIPNIDSELAPAKKTFHILNLTFLISLLVSIFLLGSLMLLGRNPWQSGLRWVGYTLLLPGAFQLAVVLVGKASITPAVTAIVGRINSNIATELKPAILVFANNTFNVLMFYAGVVFFVGLIMIVLSYVFHSVGKVQNVQPARTT